MRRLIITGLAVLSILLAGASPAAATKPDPEHKVMLCHRTASDTNPYVLIEVDEASLDAHLNNLPGHPAKENADGSPRNDYLYTEETPCEPEQPSPSPSSSPSPTPQPSVSPSPSPSVSPSPSPTTSPSATPTSSPSSTPTPASSESPSTSPAPTLPPTDTSGPALSLAALAADPSANLILAIAAVLAFAGIIAWLTGNGRENR